MVNYWDQQLVDLLAFGFPLDFDHSCPLQATEINHASATAYSDHIDKYLQDEIHLVPFMDLLIQNPFFTCVSIYDT